MNISFKPQFHQKILDGVKTSTIRRARKNIREGMIIYFRSGGRFDKDARTFATGKIVAVELIKIMPRTRFITIFEPVVGDWELSPKNIKDLAFHEGFNSVDDFWAWDYWKDKEFEGILIHWDAKSVKPVEVNA